MLYLDWTIAILLNIVWFGLFLVIDFEIENTWRAGFWLLAIYMLGVLVIVRVLLSIHPIN